MKNITVMHARYGRYNIGGIFANIRMYISAKIRMYNLMNNFTERCTTISKELLEKLLENKSTFDFHSRSHGNDRTPSILDLKILSIFSWQDFSKI